VTHWC